MSPVGSPLPADVPVALVGVVAVAVAVLWLLRPPLTRRTALAVAPWAVAGALVHVVGSFGGYPAGLRHYTTPAAVTAGAAGVAVISWAPVVKLATARGRDDDPARYLAASGTGAAVVLFAALIVRGLALSPAAVLWLTLAPVIAAVLAATAYVLLGLRVVDTLAYARFAGLFAVFGQTYDGVALAIGLEVFGAAVARPLVAPVLAVTTSRSIPPAVTLVAVKLLFGTAVAVALTRGARDDRWWAFLGLAAVGGVGLGAAVATLLLAAGG